MTARRDISQILGDLAVELEGETDTESTLRSITRAAVTLVPGARWAGISFTEGRRVEARAATDPLVAEVDELQSKFDEGPCLSALRDEHTVAIDDMAADPRWPRFTSAAVERGVRCSMSFRLFVQGGSLGSLNLYGDAPNAFDGESVFYGEVLAQHASVAVAGVNAASQFQRAIDSRDIIGQAKGLLMQRNNVNGLHAFRMLTEASQETNVKLVEIARLLVDKHESGQTKG